MAKFNAAKLKQLAKSIKLPTAEQLKTPKGRAYHLAALVAFSALIVGLSTLNPAGSNSPNGNRPGSGMMIDRSSEDYSAQEPTPSDEPSKRPISGPMASAYESQQAETEAQKALRAEISRISNLGRTDTALVAIYVTLNNYLKAAAIAQDKGDAEAKAYAVKLEAAAKALIPELEKLAKGRDLAWPTLDVEPSNSDLQHLQTNFFLASQNVEYLKSSTSLDFPNSFNRTVTSSIDDLLSFSESRTMPDDKEFEPLIKLIAGQLTPLANATDN